MKDMITNWMINKVDQCRKDLQGRGLGPKERVREMLRVGITEWVREGMPGLGQIEFEISKDLYFREPPKPKALLQSSTEQELEVIRNANIAEEDYIRNKQEYYNSPDELGEAKKAEDTTFRRRF